MSACNPTTCYKSSTHRFHLIGPIRHIRHINATSPLSCLVPRVPRSYFPRSCAYSLPRPRHAHGRKSRELLEKEKVVQARKLTLPKYMMPHKNGTSFAAFVSAQSAFHVRLDPTKENPTEPHAPVLACWPRSQSLAMARRVGCGRLPEITRALGQASATSNSILAQCSPTAGAPLTAC